VELKLEPIFEDSRGASYRVIFPDDTEMILIYTKKGAMRGGHSHDRAETSMVLSGRMKYWKKLNNGKEIEFEHGAGETLHNEPGEVHMAQALEDGWLMDWKVATKIGECVTTNYEPYRSKIKKSMEGEKK
jgi:quercetin dioxygenase-like cupin family protein